MWFKNLSSQRGMSTTIVTTGIAAAVLVAILGWYKQALNSRKNIRISTSNMNGLYFNRNAIVNFKDRWDNYHILLDINEPSVTNPPMTHTGLVTTGLAATDPWQLDAANNVFVVRSCPPRADIVKDPNTGAWRPEYASVSGCIADGIASETVVRPVKWMDTRNALIVEASTLMAGRSIPTVTTAAVITPPNTAVNAPCELQIGKQSDYSDAADVDSLEVFNGDHVYFRLKFQPLIMKDVKYIKSKIGTGSSQETAFDPIDAATSPLEWDIRFNGTGQFKIQIEMNSPLKPCGPTKVVSVEEPPPPCPWTDDPNHTETREIRLCKAHRRRGVTQYKKTTFQPFVIGLDEGADGKTMVAGHSPSRRVCLNANECRYHSVTQASETVVGTYEECVDDTNGVQPLFPTRLANGGNLTRHVYVLYNFGPNSCDDPLVYFLRSSGDGCLLPETKILMADGGMRRIDKVKSGDMVWNPLLRKGVVVDHVTMGAEKEPLRKVKFHDGTTITMTSLHPVWLKGEQYIAAKNLKPGDIIRNQNYQGMIVESIELVEPDEDLVVWNLALDSASLSAQEHYFVADGIIVGDKVLQNLIDPSLSTAMDTDPIKGKHSVLRAMGDMSPFGY